MTKVEKNLKGISINMKDLNYLISNLIGATEILEIAYLKNDKKSFMQALKRIEELRNELKKHERYTREDGTYYEFEYGSYFNLTKVKINGVDFKITEVKTRYSKYQEYLEAYYSSLISEEEYMLSKVKELYPSINESEYQNYYEVVKNQYYFDYLDIYYQYYDEYLEHLTFFDNSNFHIWLYQE